MRKERKPRGLWRILEMEARGKTDFQIQKCVVKTTRGEKRVLGVRQSGKIGLRNERLSAIYRVFLFFFRVSFLHLFVWLFLSV